MARVRGGHDVRRIPQSVVQSRCIGEIGYARIREVGPIAHDRDDGNPVGLQRTAQRASAASRRADDMDLDRFSHVAVGQFER